MNGLERIIWGSPFSNIAFTLPDTISLESLIKRCELIGKTGCIDLAQVCMKSLSEQFSEFEIVILLNVENIGEHNELLYQLSGLLDSDEPYVLYVVDNMNKFNHLQRDKAGPLFCRWSWIDDFSKLYHS